MRNIQEIEEFEHGQDGNDYQRVFAWNSMNTVGDTAKINGLVEAGRFVVADQRAVYCPSTDAAMGSRLYLVSDHATREEALAAMAHEEGHEDPDSYLMVLPTLLQTISHDLAINDELLGSDEIPF